VTQETAHLDQQTVSIPTEIAGRFDEPNDEDQFLFRAEKGKTYWIEAIADRMNSNVDPLLIIQQITRSPEGEIKLKKLGENDDLPSYFSVHNKNAINQMLAAISTVRM